MLWTVGVFFLVVWLDLHGGLHFIRRGYWNDSSRRRGIRLEALRAAFLDDRFHRACDRDSRDEQRTVRRLVVVSSPRSRVAQPEEALEIELARAA
jgi:hypothetical protein